MAHDDGTIDLRKEELDVEFKIGNIEGNAPAPKGDRLEGIAMSENELSSIKTADKIKVKFDKFVNLIASHAYEDIINKHIDDDVIISTDLLTDLANAHEEKQDRKSPLLFIVGILLGVAVTYFLVSK